MRLFWVFFVALLVAAPACDQSAEPGTEGGWCRIGPLPCDSGLTCQNGGCYPGVASSGEPRLGARVTYARDGELIDEPYLVADGQDRLAVRIELKDLDTREPHIEAVRLRVNPPEAGLALSTVLVPDDDGVATTMIRACDAEDEACPTRLLLEVSTAVAPMRGIARSASIEIDGGNEDAPGPMYGGGPLPGGDQTTSTGSSGGGGGASDRDENEGLRRENGCDLENTFFFTDHPESFEIAKVEGVGFSGDSAGVVLRTKSGELVSISVSGLDGEGFHELSARTRLMFTSPYYSGSSVRRFSTGSVTVTGTTRDLRIFWTGTDARGRQLGCLHINQ